MLYKFTLWFDDYLVYTDHHLYIKHIHAIVINKMLHQTHTVVPDKLVIILYKSATSFFFMHIILCPIVAFDIANIKMISVLPCRSDIAFN